MTQRGLDNIWESSYQKKKQRCRHVHFRLPMHRDVCSVCKATRKCNIAKKAKLISIAPLSWRHFFSPKPFLMAFVWKVHKYWSMIPSIINVTSFGELWGEFRWKHIMVNKLRIRQNTTINVLYLLVCGALQYIVLFIQPCELLNVYITIRSCNNDRKMKACNFTALSEPTDCCIKRQVILMGIC